MFQAKVEKSKHRVCIQSIVIAKGAVCEIMWGKYCTAGQATEDNMAHANCMLDNKG
jgi:hypothetical protein